MEEVIGDLDSMKMDLRNWQGQLREISWPARSISLVANDLITWLGMAASTAETLTRVLVPLEKAKAEVKEVMDEKTIFDLPIPEEAKAEVKEIIEEEEGVEVPSEPVQEPEDREAGDTPPVQEPGPEASEGD